MTNSNAKGDRRERELVNLLDDDGFAVMRAPASGSATERELPDVLAGRGGEMWALEVKASGGDPIYLTDHEVEDLEFFAKGFGATAAIGVRFDYDDWYFCFPERCHKTPTGYRIREQEAHDHGVHVEGAILDGDE